jgi:hypothetical protein
VLFFRVQRKYGIFSSRTSLNPEKQHEKTIFLLVRKYTRTSLDPETQHEKT